MRELRRDEIDLINRVRKRDTPMVLAVKKLTLATKRMGKVLTVDEVEQARIDMSVDQRVRIPVKWARHGRTVNCRSTLTPVGGDGVIPVHVDNEPSPNIPIPPEDFPQEDTLEQIKRMVDHLPENHFCEQTEGECPILMTLMISTWARDFLKQMIRDVERRPRC